MKKLLALLLALMMVFALSACGDSDASATPEEVTGETYNAGNFSVLVPDGWTAYPVMDVWSDDANATDPDKVNIGKGTSSEFDLYSKPYMQIVHYDPDTTVLSAKEFYDNVVDIAPFTAGGLSWEGFSGESLGSAITVLSATNADGHQFQVNMYTQGKISQSDADVLAILGSIVMAA